MSVAGAVSRITGFVRVLVVASALGTTFLANTYQTANTAPNLIFELVAAGVLTSIFVPTFVDLIVRGDRSKGWEAGDALTSVAAVALVVISVGLALSAAPIMRLLTIGVDDPSLRSEQIALGATWLRLFAPQVVFYGVGMILTAALHAHRRFAAPAIAPIFNNVVVIVVYLLYSSMRGDRPPTVEGITSAETLLLGLGTTAGVVAMTLFLLPALRGIGWRFRFRFNPVHPEVRRAARLGSWALGYAGGYQAGLVVTLLLANQIAGGVAAYQWAFTFFFVPHALLAVPIANAVFPALSEHASRQEMTELRDRLSNATRMTVFLLVPTAAWMVAGSEPLARLTLEYGVMSADGARLVGRVIAAFAIGAPTYSLFLLMTRAFYALGDTRSPTVLNALAVMCTSGLSLVAFAVASDEWAVAGLGLAHSTGFAVGSLGMMWRFRRKLPAREVERSGRRGGLLIAGVAALAVMAVLVSVLPDSGSKATAAGTLALLAVAGGGVYLLGAAWARVPELDRARRFIGRR